MAVATSLTSARVGVGEMIIDSSICVATTTGLPSWRAAATIRFCSGGTPSGGSSTPRSPRATITASASSMISSSRSIAAGFSILASSAALSPISARASATSSGRWTNDKAIQSAPCSSAKCEVASVLVGQRRDRHQHVGDVDALVVARPCRRPRPRLRSGPRSTASDAQPDLAVVDQQPVAGADRLEQFGVRQLDPARRRRALRRGRA